MVYYMILTNGLKCLNKIELKLFYVRLCYSICVMHLTGDRKMST